MRVAVLARNRRKGGGVESYLDGIIPELLKLGHDVAFISEVEGPLDREQIPLPEGVPAWAFSESGAEDALRILRAWKPDVIYAHSFFDPALEARTLEVAPSVFFAHVYHGTCISGSKTLSSPTARPCTRRFGWPCLLQYYPNRCGGLSPLTMFSEFQRQHARLQLLHRYKAVLTNSLYMQAELAEHHVNARCLYLPVDAEPVAVDKRMSTYRLLFLGRMERLKGGRLLIDAAPKVCAALSAPLYLTFAGDGPERALWEHEAARVQSVNPGLKIDFTGWVDGARKRELFIENDLLVIPSVWPEPFGMVGPEAGLHSMPAVAFNVGGINEWLTDGVNGYLAPGDLPTSEALVEAILKCLRDPDKFASLRQGALHLAQRFSMENHLAALVNVFEEVAASV